MSGTQPGELERLRDRIAELEELVGLHERIPWWLGTKLTPMQAKLLSLLLKRELVSQETACIAIYGNGVDSRPAPKIIDTFVHHIRQKLKPYSVKISNAWSRGYYIDAENKQKLRELIARAGAEGRTGQ